jgi:hypothetical protein
MTKHICAFWKTSLIPYNPLLLLGKNMLEYNKALNTRLLDFTTEIFTINTVFITCVNTPPPILTNWVEF